MMVSWLGVRQKLDFPVMINNSAKKLWWDADVFAVSKRRYSKPLNNYVFNLKAKAIYLSFHILKNI